ncbi:hypothetical protein [Butyrivibrio sp. MC2021]|uniref:hypothetical protein n=1 Tax=Butyrivibrio sp. MC2021 TaxID=1408306 RepID=UPI001FA7FD96|nr:hypothetical protein [Butyrivibrio sp. MC2021]
MHGFGKREMNNPWEEIKLDDYEKHMSLDSVKQLQTINKMMKEQFDAYQVNTAMIFGIAGGNGLEHVNKEKYQIVYGVDINKEYLEAVSGRYTDLSGVLQCLQVDLIKDTSKLPNAQLLIANLLIEYIGYQKILEETESLPNGKALLRIDFKKGKERTYGIN